MDIQKIAVHLFKNYPYKFRNSIYRLVGIKLNGSDIRSNVIITNPKNLFLGKNVLINHNCSFVLGAGNATVTIGDNVQLGPSCVVTTITHEYSNPNKRAGNITYKSISIGDGTWIGCSCTILAGVTIGKGCVIAAGSVVNKDIPKNQLYGGVPAKFIKELQNN